MKIISGGQTGVDRAALDIALETEFLMAAGAHKAAGPRICPIRRVCWPSILGCADARSGSAPAHRMERARIPTGCWCWWTDPGCILQGTEFALRLCREARQAISSCSTLTRATRRAGGRVARRGDFTRASPARARAKPPASPPRRAPSCARFLSRFEPWAPSSPCERSAHFDSMSACRAIPLHNRDSRGPHPSQGGIRCAPKISRRTCPMSPASATKLKPEAPRLMASPVVASDKLARIKVRGETIHRPLGRRVRDLGGKGRRVLDHRLRDRAGRPSRLAHGRHRGDAVHHRRHRRAENGGRQHPSGRPGSVFVLPTNCATTSPTPARRRCARSRSSPRRCSRRTSTR